MAIRTVAPTESRPFIELIADEEVTAGDLAASRREFWEKGGSRDVWRVLFDGRAVCGGADPIELALHFEALGQLKGAHGFRIALVLASDKDSARTMKLADTLAVNRGLTAHVFVDRPSAVEWLQSDDPSDRFVG